MARHRDGHGIEAGSEEPRRLFACLSVLNVGAIVGLAEAPRDPGAGDEPEITIEKRHNRNQCPTRHPIASKARRLESRMKVLLQIRRIDPVGDDDEVLERRFGGQAPRNRPRQKSLRETEILDRHLVRIRLTGEANLLCGPCELRGFFFAVNHV